MNRISKPTKYNLLVLACLLLCALIYIFYRTESSLINIVLNGFMPDTFIGFKEGVRNILPLHEAIIYSVPGGLWVFCATLMARNLLLPIFQKQFNLEWFPMGFALWLECWQYFGVVKGRFDLVDILFVLVFGLLAKFIFNRTYNHPIFFNTLNKQRLAFTFIFLSVFMAHVFE
jgi:hypothetical protein